MIEGENFKKKESISTLAYERATLNEIREALEQEGLIIINGFPPEKEELFELGSKLGIPMESYRGHEYIGEVRMREDLASKDQFLKETDSELRIHTAKAWSAHRPKFFGMLMVEPGLRGDDVESGGRSYFAKWDDVVAKHIEMFPETAENDIEHLSTTPISFAGAHFKKDCAFEPVLWVNKKEEYCCRYKLDVEKMLSDSVIQGDREHYREAVIRFDHIANSPDVQKRIALERGDLVLLDNARHGHARSRIQSHDVGGNLNPRLLYNIQIA